MATLVNWSCHPECLPRERTRVTADFCAPLLQRIEAERGGIALFVTGAIGGLMTPGGVRLLDPETGNEVPEDTWRHAEVLAENLARYTLEALSRAPVFDPTPVAFRSREVDVPLDNDLFRGGAGLGVFGGRVPLYTDGDLDQRTRPTIFRGIPVFLPLGRDLRTEVGLFSLGRASLVCVPGEIYPELVFGGIEDPPAEGADYPDAPAEPLLAPMLPAGPHFILGLANDEIGYILPRRQWDTEAPFAYGREEAQYGEINSVGPGVAERLAQAFQALVEEQ
jgi:hypothetical protein